MNSNDLTDIVKTHEFLKKEDLYGRIYKVQNAILNKIEQANECGLDITDPTAYANLQMAQKVYASLLTELEASPASFDTIKWIFNNGKLRSRDELEEVYEIAKRSVQRTYRFKHDTEDIERRTRTTNRTCRCIAYITAAFVMNYIARFMVFDSSSSILKQILSVSSCVTQGHSAWLLFKYAVCGLIGGTVGTILGIFLRVKAEDNLATGEWIAYNRAGYDAPKRNLQKFTETVIDIAILRKIFS